MRNGMRNRGGFTLLEIIVVMVIVGIMLTIGGSNLLLWLDHAAAVEFQREILSRSNDARTRAMASNLQHRMRVDITGETITLQRGNLGSGSTSWSNVGNPIVGNRGAGIQEIVYDNGTTVSASTNSFIFNPGGQVLALDNSTIILPMNQARIRLTAGNTADRATIRIFGFTSKARLENGWN